MLIVQCSVVLILYDFFVVDNIGQHTTRGRTTLKELWELPYDERIVVSKNSDNQPIGPEAQVLAGLLGMIARNGRKVPIHYESWHEVLKKNKFKVLDFVKVLV